MSTYSVNLALLWGDDSDDIDGRHVEQIFRSIILLYCSKVEKKCYLLYILILTTGMIAL